MRRAVFHFINQTLFRVPRYRIYLVLYGGVGLSVLIATVLRLTVINGQLHAEASADGIRVAVGIVAFWVATGLRTAFVSSGNQKGSWIFRFTHGRPAHFVAAMDELTSARLYLRFAAHASCCAPWRPLKQQCVLRLVAPAEVLSVQATAAQMLVGAGICIILCEALFANVMIVPFTGDAAGEKPNLAFTLLKFFTFFPAVTTMSLLSEQWVEEGVAALRGGHHRRGVVSVCGFAIDIANRCGSTAPRRSWRMGKRIFRCGSDYGIRRFLGTVFAREADARAIRASSGRRAMPGRVREG